MARKGILKKKTQSQPSDPSDNFNKQAKKILLDKNKKTLLEINKDLFNESLEQGRKVISEKEKNLPKPRGMKWYNIKERFPPETSQIILVKNVRYEDYELFISRVIRGHLIMERFWWKKNYSIEKWLIIED